MTNPLYIEGCCSEDLVLAVRRLTLGRVLAAYHATKSLAHLLEDEDMDLPLSGLDCLTCLARVGDDGSCWCTCLWTRGRPQGDAVSPMLTVAIDEAEYEDENFYDEPTCEFCGCSESVWCEHELL